MVASSFETAFAFVERPDNDGQGFHITRGDVGGATAWSVIWPTYKTYCQAVGKPALLSEFRAFTADDAKPVLKLLFWTPMACDALPAGVDMECFDMEVGSGLIPTTRILQEAINKVRPATSTRIVVDGHIGVMTIGAAHACDPAELIDAMGAIETAFYHSLPSDAEFDDGWKRRATQRHAVAKGLIPPSIAEARHDLGQFGTLAVGSTLEEVAETLPRMGTETVPPPINPAPLDIPVPGSIGFGPDPRFSPEEYSPPAPGIVVAPGSQNFGN